MAGGRLKISSGTPGGSRSPLLSAELGVFSNMLFRLAMLSDVVNGYGFSKFDGVPGTLYSCCWYVVIGWDWACGSANVEANPLLISSCRYC